MNEDRIGLERRLGLGAVTFYAIGDILGAGIYALVGKVIGTAGGSAWIAFGIAALLALVTGLTYAELCSRHPHAAGAAAYVQRAFRQRVPAFVVGMLVLVSGITSAAAVAHAFVGYLRELVSVPLLVTSVGLLGLMSLVSYWGIEESARVNLVLTLVELSGLLLVIGVGAWFAARHGGGELAARVRPDAGAAAVLSASTLAFYAFIGFEDTVHVAEEVREPERVMPRAILIAIGVTSLVYLLVILAALRLASPAELGASKAPLLDALAAAGIAVPGGAFAIVALLAIGNTGLLNLIMASRLTYGMAREGLLPAPLARVHPRRRTPWVSVLLAFVLAAALAATGGVRVLAETTSLLLVLVFLSLHASLLVLRRREPEAPFRAPRPIPWAGLGLCVLLLLRYSGAAYLRASVVVAVALGVYLVLGGGRAGG